MNNTNNLIHIILTGGRIDSVWDGRVDEVILAKHSVIPDFFKSLKIDDLEFSEVCMKDSRALTNEDRKNILDTINNNRSNKILITHGTHTLADTVEFLQANLGKSNKKTIVLTGSSTPLKDFVQSDAAFNLGYALAKVEELPAGIYFCINKITIPAGKIV